MNVPSYPNRPPMPQEVGEHEEQKGKSNCKDMVLELLEDVELTMEECPKTV
jgi:hypothetical protein